MRPEAIANPLRCFDCRQLNLVTAFTAGIAEQSAHTSDAPAQYDTGAIAARMTVCRFERNANRAPKLQLPATVSPALNSILAPNPSAKSSAKLGDS